MNSNIKYSLNLLHIKENIDYAFNIIEYSIGIPFNILSIIIFARLLRNKNNMGFLYIWQCSIDLCILLFNLFILRSHINLGIRLQNQSACKASLYVYRILVHASSWIAVLTTFDRFTFVLYGHNNRFRFLKSKRNLTCIILAILTIITILDIPNYFFYYDDDSNQKICNADIAIKFATDIISILLRTHFPFVLIFIFNAIMIRKIVKTRKNTSIQNANLRKHNNFTIAVIAYDVFFFALNAPLSIYHMFYDVNFISGHLTKNFEFQAKYALVNAFTANLSICEQIFSFLMYFAFNKLFRKELLYIIDRIFRFRNVSQLKQNSN